MHNLQEKQFVRRKGVPRKRSVRFAGILSHLSNNRSAEINVYFRAGLPRIHSQNNSYTHALGVGLVFSYVPDVNETPIGEGGLLVELVSEQAPRIEQIDQLRALQSLLWLYEQDLGTLDPS